MLSAILVVYFNVRQVTREAGAFRKFAWRYLIVDEVSPTLALALTLTLALVLTFALTLALTLTRTLTLTLTLTPARTRRTA